MIEHIAFGSDERLSRRCRPVRPSRGLAIVLVTAALAGSCGPSAAWPSPPAEASEPVGRDAASVEVSWSAAAELTVEALVREVLARNPTLASMRAAWEAAAERYPQVTSLEDPQLSYGLAPATIGDSQFDVGQRFELSQRFPWPGTLSTRGEVAAREAEAAAEEVGATRLRLVESAREAFYDWWYVHRAIEINDMNLELLAELRDVAETRYAAGLASKQDALQAEVEHQRIVHRSVVLGRVLDVAHARLNALLNRPAKDPVPPPPVTLPPPAGVRSPKRLESESIKQRPALRAARRRIEARKADVRLAELEFFPNLTVMGTYNTLWEADELRPMVGVGVNLPIQLERRRAALGEARAELRRAESRLAEETAAVLFEVSRALDELREQEHVVRLYRTSIVPAAEESLASARSGYEAASNDFLTLIQAEKDYLAAELTYRQGVAELHKAHARLERAVGVPLEEMEEGR